MGIPIQLHNEALLHREQRLYPVPHENPLQVSLLVSALLSLTLSNRTYILTASPLFRALEFLVRRSPRPATIRPTHDPSIDTFRVEFLLGPSFLLSLLFNYKFTFVEVLWSFSIFLESVAILPQLFMLQRTGEAETITTHYVAALGAYRALYIPNWIYRYFSEGTVDPIAVIAGLVQTGLYLDFFYIYFTK